ncbi:MAG: cation diffusion facilitator family transporter [Planctomycetota bacterium]
MAERERPDPRKRIIRRATLIGMGLNLMLAVAKLIVGVLAHSQAVVADGFHSLSDLTTDLGLLIGLHYWSKPRDQDHPYGHGRIELLVTTGIGLLLFGVATGIVIEAIDSLSNIQGGTSPAPLAFWTTVAAIFAKEGLYRYTRNVGRATKSSALLANAWHHRTDALSSIPAAVSVLLGMINPSWIFVDAVGAAAVSLLIFQAAFKIMKPALGHLIDAGAPLTMCDELQQTALGVKGVETAHALRTRYLGATLAVDLHITVDPQLSVCRGHAISQRVEEALREDFETVTDVIVHIEPFCDDCRYGETLLRAGRETR